MSRDISGTTNRSYGGKLGVWLTKKRNIQIPRHRNNSFRNRNRQHQQHHHHLLHTLLPGRLGLVSSRDRRVPSRGIGNVNAINRGSTVNINTSFGGNGLIGWDEVRCRPVYLNSQDHNSDPDLNENDKENVDALNNASMGRTERSEYYVSASNNDDDFDSRSGGIGHLGEMSIAMQNMDTNGGGDRLTYRSQYASNDDDVDKYKKSSLSDSFPVRNNTAAIQNSKYKYSKTRGKGKGKTYGNNNKRIGRLSTMASSVLDAYASPLWKTKPYGKKKRKNGTASASAFALSILTVSDSIVKSSGSTSSTSSKNDTSMTLSSSSSGSSPLPDAASSGCHFDSSESNECTGEFEFEASDDSRYRKRKSSSISSSSNPNENNDCHNEGRNHPNLFKQTQKQVAKRNLKREGKSLLQQPNCTTCLKDAKAYFQHLDGYQLNIDSL
uniref:Uncharacterized protein n=1 Tax=Chaetoceros debilis TaxID=122233 RepID=A0A7S3QJZ7_9STRA